MRGPNSALKSRRRRRFSVEALELRQLLATITVNGTADDVSADSTLSLREAIEVSDGALALSSLSSQEQAQVSGDVGNSNTIDFNIPTSDSGYNSASGVWTIAVGEFPLPAISTNAAIIDGYSQPGSSENTLAHGDNAKLTIAIDVGLHEFDGLTIAQQGSKVSGLDIEHSQNGIVIAGGGNVQVAGCFIGTDPTGETAASNSNGIVIQSSSNLIGGPNVGDRNVISSNIQSSGIYVPGQTNNPLGITPTANVVENNIIGLDAKGTKVLSNSLEGVTDSGTGDTYGGTTPGLGNVVSGNGEGGIYAIGSITIEGNYIGTDVTGNVALGNGPNQSGGTGISIADVYHPTSITVVISNNLISGNGDGISIGMVLGTQSSFMISNNLIGTNAAGTSALANVGDGLTLNSVENATIQNNVISSNYNGVVLQTAGTATELQHDVFLGNLIGTDKTGTVALGNKGVGIEIDPGSGITIGGTGPGQGNVIANNLIGIDLSRGQQDQFIQNSIYGNTGEYNIPPGIIVPPSTNQAVAAPALLFTPGAGGTGTLSGAISEVPNSDYVVEVFSNPSAAIADQAQGQTFVQDFTVHTDGSGNGTFTSTEPNGFYTATASDTNGNTSAFSNAAGLAQSLPASTTAISSSLNPATVGEKVTFTAVVTAPSFQGTPTGSVIFTIDGNAQPSVPLSVVGGVDEAQFSTATLTAGQHTVTAAYSGDANVSASSGSLPTQAVNPPSVQPTTTTLSTSTNPSTVGEQVTFTAVVSAPTYQGTPSGSVTFTIDGQSQPPVALSVVGGVDEAQFSTATLTAGPHTVSAAFGGDANVSPSSGSLPTQTVNAHSLKTTATTLTSATDPSAVGQTVTFTAVVSSAGNAGNPSGSVTFTIDGVPHAPVPIQVVKGSDRATLSIASLGAGRHTITAAYSGDSTFAASASASPLVQTVQPAAAARCRRSESAGRAKVWRAHAADGRGIEFQRVARRDVRGESEQLPDYRSCWSVNRSSVGSLRLANKHGDSAPGRPDQPPPSVPTHRERHGA